MAFEQHLTILPTDSPTRFTCEYSPFVLTPRGTLQGGAGLAAALMATEVVTGRPTVWAAAQYLAFAAGREPVQLDVTVEVEGHHTTQARCVLSRNGTEVLTTHAALGSKPFSPGGTWVERPLVPGPDECEPFRFFAKGKFDLGDIVELRLAHGRQIRDLLGRPGGGNTAFWCRVSYGRHPVGVGELAFIGDLLPLAFCEPYGLMYAGTSIDNTIRVGARVETEWVLLDCRMEQVASGFGYGHAYLWSQDGDLLGTASQTMAMRMETRDEVSTAQLNRPTA
jgi:acyl-CoA thioesterase II